MWWKLYFQNMCIFLHRLSSFGNRVQDANLNIWNCVTFWKTEMTSFPVRTDVHAREISAALFLWTERKTSRIILLMFAKLSLKSNLIWEAGLLSVPQNISKIYFLSDKAQNNRKCVGIYVFLVIFQSLLTERNWSGLQHEWMKSFIFIIYCWPKLKS